MHGVWNATEVTSGAILPTAVQVGPLMVALDANAPMRRAFGNPFAVAPTGMQPDYRITVGAGSCGTTAPDLVPTDRAGDMLVRAGPDTYTLWTGRFGAGFHAVDRVARRAQYWTPDAAVLPAWERSRPFLPAFQAMLHDTDWLAVHAAGIAIMGRGMLLVGLGGAGKTSLALAALQAGWRYAGDDFVLLRASAQPVIASLYATARLRDDMADRFPSLLRFRREVSADAGDTRHELQLAAAAHLGGATLAAIVLVQRLGAATPQLEPVGRAGVTAALSATTTVATPGGAEERLRKLLRIMQGFKPWRFDPGPDPGRALECLAGLLT